MNLNNYVVNVALFMVRLGHYCDPINTFVVRLGLVRIGHYCDASNAYVVNVVFVDATAFPPSIHLKMETQHSIHIQSQVRLGWILCDRILDDQKGNCV